MKEIPQNRDIINLISSPRLETKDDRKPFLIRGHHLRFYHSLLNQYSPFRNAAPLVMSQAHVNQWITEQCKAQQASSTNQQAEQRVNYFKDLIGDTPKERIIFQKRYQKTLEKFLNLPDDHPVTLIQGQKDAMCNNCIIGKHCTDRTQFNTDKYYLDIFQAEVSPDKQNKPTPIIKKLIQLFDASNQKKSLITDAGTVKRILWSTPYEKWDDTYKNA